MTRFGGWRDSFNASSLIFRKIMRWLIVCFLIIGLNKNQRRNSYKVIPGII